jgi:hypothetical protein
VNDEAFEGFIKSHAGQIETETLHRVTEHLREIIAQRLTGKPSWLKRGSRIHALDLKLDWNKYGEVVRISGKSCFIIPPASQHEERIVFSRHAIRLVDEIEWNNIVWHFTDRKADYESKRAAEIDERHRDREEAIKNRGNPKRRLVRVAYRDVRRDRALSLVPATRVIKLLPLMAPSVACATESEWEPPMMDDGAFEGLRPVECNAPSDRDASECIEHLRSRLIQRIRGKPQGPAKSAACVLLSVTPVAC